MCPLHFVYITHIKKILDICLVEKCGSNKIHFLQTLRKIERTAILW